MTDDDPNRSDDTGPSAADGRLRGPEGVRTREELGAALTERRESAGLSVREVAEQADALLGTVAGWFAGQHAPTKASREPFERVLAVCGVAPGELADWWTAVDNLSRRGARTRKGRPESPYLGFTTFGATDKARYFGRSTEIEMVVRQVVEIHRTWRDSLTPSGVGSAVPPAFAVLGRSGVGKSSLVQVALGGTAGEPGPLREWKYAHMVPGHDPVGAMTAALSELDAQTDRTGPSILVIDQYEELITLHSYDEAIVAGAVWIEMTLGRDMVVVAVVRPDFLAFADDAQSMGVPLGGQILVMPMSIDHLREVIVAPAEAAGVTVDDDLVKMLLDDVSSASGVPAAGALPLLSHALRATWLESDGRRMTVRDYLATGRIAGAVEKTAEDVYRSLTDDEQAAARELLLAMVNVDEDMVTRRVVPLADLAADEGPRADLLERFAATRLLTVSQDDVQVTHEALLTAWPRLTEWIATDRERLSLVRRLRSVSEVWDANGRIDDLLPGPARLQMFDELVGDSALDQTSRAYLDAGDAKRRAQVEAEERSARKLRDRTRFALIFGLVAVLAAVLAIATSINAAVQRDRAERAGTESLSRQLAAEAIQLSNRDPFLAAQLSMVAYRQAPTREARSALIDLVSGPVPAGIEPLADDAREMATATTSDGSMMLAAYSDGRFRIMPLGEHGIAAYPRTGTFGSGDRSSALAFLPRSRTVLSGGKDRIIGWDLTDSGRPVRGTSLPGVRGTPTSITVAADGNHVAAVTEANSVAFWARAGNRWRQVAVPAVLRENARSVAFSPDGRLLATGTDYQRVDLWAVSDDGLAPVSSMTLPGPDLQLATGLAFAANGRSLVTRLRLQGVAMYDITDPRQPKQSRMWRSSSAFVSGFGLSGDGSRVAVASSDNTVRIYEVATPDSAPRLLRSPARSMVFSGEHLITVDPSGRILDWPLARASTRIGAGTVQQVAASTDGSRVFAVEPDAGRLHQWRAADGALSVSGPPLSVPATGGASGILATGGSGRVVVVGGLSGELNFADYSDPARPHYVSQVKAQDTISISIDYNEASGLVIAGSMDSPMMGIVDATDISRPRKIANVDIGGPAVLVTLSPDGRRAAVATVSGAVKLVDLTDPAKPRVISQAYRFGGMAMAARFSPDGRKLAVGSEPATVAVVDVSDPSRPKPITEWSGTAELVYAVDFSKDGTRVVAGSGNSEVWIWQIGKREPDVVLRSFPGGVYDVRFLADRMLVAVGDGGTVRTWLPDPDALIARQCARPGDPLGRDEWAKYMQGRKYSPPCGRS